MNDLVSQLVGFALGVLASVVFWYLMLVVKPNIAISPNIAYNDSSKRLRIKVVNQSSRQVTDLDARLQLYEINEDEDGRIAVHKHTFELTRDLPMALGGRQDAQKPWLIDPAYRFVFKDDSGGVKEMLRSKTDKERRLIFTIAATDATSGTKIVKRVTYGLENIKTGAFEPGLTVEIK